MALYLVVEFDKNDEAEAFKETLNAGDASLRVVAQFKKPTQFCDCADYDGTSILGSTNNWRVHKKCMRPRKGVWQTARDMMRPTTESVTQRRIILHIQEPRADYVQ